MTTKEILVVGALCLFLILLIISMNRQKHFTYTYGDKVIWRNRCATFRKYCEHSNTHCIIAYKDIYGDTHYKTVAVTEIEPYIGA